MNEKLQYSQNPDLGKSSKERELPTDLDVVIVGAGLSGRMLASSLGADISYAIIDSRKPRGSKKAMYLVSNNIADVWDLDKEDQQKRNKITRSTYYMPSGEMAGEFTVTDNNKGFITFPQTALEKAIEPPSENLYFQTNCMATADVTDGISVQTDKGTINTKIVIDATGWNGSIMHDYYGDEDYLMAAIYGGTYKTDNIDPSTLYMIRGLPLNNKNWIMPVGKNGAEVVATQQLKKSEADTWWDNHAEEELKAMFEWYEDRGLVVYDGEKGEKMGFRMEPAKKRFYKGRVIPFGESAGLNSPHIGQLIDTLPEYAKRLGDMIQDAKDNNSWESVGLNYYDSFIKDPVFAYLPHSVMRNNSVKLQDGYPRTNQLLTDLMKTSFSNDELWDVFNNNGLGVSEIQRIAKEHPLKLAQFVIQSVPSMASVLVQNPELYIQFAAHLAKTRNKNN